MRAAGVVPAIMIRPTVVLFGDSITQLGFGGPDADGAPGWAALLAAAYARRADVLNRGYSGYNTRMALDALPSVFGPEAAAAEADADAAPDGGEGGGAGVVPPPSPAGWRPLFVTVFFGANDASLPGERAHNQHVPPDEYEANLRAIVRSIGGRFGAGGCAGPVPPPIVLIAPPPVSRKAWDAYCVENSYDPSPRSNEAARRYGDRVRSVASELGCSVVDSWRLLGGDDSEETYGKHLEDGLHLNGSGNRLLFEGVMEVLKRDFPELAPMEDDEKGGRGIPLEGALWKDLC